MYLQMLRGCEAFMVPTEGVGYWLWVGTEEGAPENGRECGT